MRILHNPVEVQVAQTKFNIFGILLLFSEQADAIVVNRFIEIGVKRLVYVDAFAVVPELAKGKMHRLPGLTIVVQYPVCIRAKMQIIMVIQCSKSLLAATLEISNKILTIDIQ
jgi:hypothetical protein